MLDAGHAGFDMEAALVDMHGADWLQKIKGNCAAAPARLEARHWSRGHRYVRCRTCSHGRWEERPIRVAGLQPAEPLYGVTSLTRDEAEAASPGAAAGQWTKRSATRAAWPSARTPAASAPATGAWRTRCRTTSRWRSCAAGAKNATRCRRRGSTWACGATTPRRRSRSRPESRAAGLTPQRAGGRRDLGTPARRVPQQGVGRGMGLTGPVGRAASGGGGGILPRRVGCCAGPSAYSP